MATELPTNPQIAVDADRYLAQRVLALEAEVERLTEHIKERERVWAERERGALARAAELEAAQRVHPSLAGVNPVDVIILCGVLDAREFYNRERTMLVEPAAVRAKRRIRIAMGDIPIAALATDGAGKSAK